MPKKEGFLAMLAIFEKGHMFNGLQNLLSTCIGELTDKEVQEAMRVAEKLYPETKDINHSDSLKAIKKAMDKLTDHNDLFIIYVCNILEYRRLWNAFCAYCQDNH